MLRRLQLGELLAIEDFDTEADWLCSNSAEVAPRNFDTKFLFEPLSYQLHIKTHTSCHYIFI
jgi:hypothetical protein